MSKRIKKQNIFEGIVGIIIAISFLLYGYINTNNEEQQVASFDLSTIPEYTSTPYVVINGAIKSATMYIRIKNEWKRGI